MADGQDQTPQAPQSDSQYQYRPLPDGKWGKFRANATEDEIQQKIKSYAPGGSSDLKLPAPVQSGVNAVRNFNQGAVGSPDVTSFGSRLWGGIKNEYARAKDMGDPVTYAGDIIDRVGNSLEESGNQQAANVQKYPPSDPRMYEAAVPFLGNSLVNTTNKSLKEGPLQGVAYGAGQAAQLGIGAKIPGKVAGAVEDIPGAMQASRLRRSQNLMERTVAPAGLPAEEQATLRSNIQRAQPALAQEAATVGPAQAGEGGVVRVANRARIAANNLWDKNVTPFIGRFGNVVDPTVPQIGQEIRGSLTDLNLTKPGAAPAAERLAQVFDKPMTVQDMYNTVTELNNDKSVSRYFEMTDQERAAAQMADPGLRNKVTALGMLRKKMVDAIGDASGESLGAQFADFRKQYGAISDVESRLRGTNVPTPQPFMSRLANSARMSISPGFAREYLSRPVDTMFGLSNPNRLATKSFNLLGKTDLGPGSPSPFPGAYSEPIGPQGPGFTPEEQTIYAESQKPAPQPPPPAQPQVGAPPTLGFNVNVPQENISQMWGRDTAPIGTEQRPGANMFPPKTPNAPLPQAQPAIAGESLPNGNPNFNFPAKPGVPANTTGMWGEAITVPINSTAPGGMRTTPFAPAPPERNYFNLPQQEPSSGSQVPPQPTGSQIPPQPTGSQLQYPRVAQSPTPDVSSMGAAAPQASQPQPIQAVSAPSQPLNYVPALGRTAEPVQPVNPQEAADLSSLVKKPVSPNEVPGMYRKAAETITPTRQSAANASNKLDVVEQGRKQRADIAKPVEKPASDPVSQLRKLPTPEGGWTANRIQRQLKIGYTRAVEISKQMNVGK